MSEFRKTANLLKECYELATYYETDVSVLSILQEKIKGLEDSLDRPLYQNKNTIETFQYEHKASLNSEKEYQLAVLALRKGTTETQRVEALRHLKIAISQSLNDPRIVTLAKILTEIDD